MQTKVKHHYKQQKLKQASILGMYFMYQFSQSDLLSENVSDHLQLQGSEVQESHQAIVKDLADARHQAQDIYQKIGNEILNSSQKFKNMKLKLARWILCVCADHSMLEFLQYQDQTSQYYVDLMNKLERMNSTLGSMLHYLDHMQSRVEERLHMIQGYLGWAGEMTCNASCFFHRAF